MNFKLNRKLVLASKSPRRKEILKKIGMPFICRSSSFQEDLNSISNTNMGDIPVNFAIQKALAVKYIHSTDLILGFDTCVFLSNRLLGKPGSPKEAYKTLKSLNGKSHYVITGAALISNGKVIKKGKEKTKVTFTKTPLKTLFKYANSGEPLDKAGSYGIQGLGSILVKKIDGCYYNVVGLPINLVLKMLDPYIQ